MTGPRTVWRLRAIAGWGGGLDVTVAVDTTAMAVIFAIEQAARENGIALERVDGDEHEPAILDGIRMAHDFRNLLWATWGERSVPRLSILEHECRLEVRGTDGIYAVTISRLEEEP